MVNGHGNRISHLVIEVQLLAEDIEFFVIMQHLLNICWMFNGSIITSAKDSISLTWCFPQAEM